MKVGLTGGTGTGKSSVSRIFKENGFEILDFDLISRQVCGRGSKCLEEICLNFGRGILNEDLTLNRKSLGAIVFADKEKLDILNSITHKYILLRSEEILRESKSENFVFDAPLLFETKLEKKCDCVVSVLSSVEKRAERIVKRDSISYEYALKRINSQRDDEFYIEKSDYIIYNNKSADELKLNTIKLIEEIKKMSYRNFSAVKIYGKDVL